jgi:predicted outer membrane repeat protein
VITGNTAGEQGGGLYVHGDGAECIGGEISGNSAVNEGGGVLAEFLAVLRFEGAVIAGNAASAGSQGSARHEASAELVCCTTDPAGWLGNVVHDDDCGD